MVKNPLGSVSTLLVIAIIFLLSAVEAAESGATKNTNQQAVTIGVDTIPDDFHPYVDMPLDLQYTHLFFDPLVRWGTSKQIEKRLVNSWQLISPGVTRFNLKKNIYFHSGNQLQSQDITWTFSQILANKHTNKNFAGIDQIKQVGAYRFDVYSHLSQAQILDYFTHFFVLDSLFYQNKSSEINKQKGGSHAESLPLSISGTGPYKIKTYKSSYYLQVVSNKDYWKGQVSQGELNFIKIKSDSARTYALLANDIDITESVSIPMLRMLKLATSKSIIEIPSPSIAFLTINEERSAVFKDQSVRQAINLAINKKGMLEHLINNMGRVAATYSPFDQSDELPIYDIDKAKSLLHNIKVPLEMTLLSLSDSKINTAEVTTALVNMMKRLGVKLLVTEVSNREFWNKNIFAYDFSLSFWHSPLLNRDNLYHHLFTGGMFSTYFEAFWGKQNLKSSLDQKIDAFNDMQHTYRISPLFFQNKTWAADNRFNLNDIFSVNGIPYWQLLTAKAN